MQLARPDLRLLTNLNEHKSANENINNKLTESNINVQLLEKQIETQKSIIEHMESSRKHWESDRNNIQIELNKYNKQWTYQILSTT